MKLEELYIDIKPFFPSRISEGRYVIEKIQVSEHEIKFAALRGDRTFGMQPGEYIRLSTSMDTIMSDTPMELITNEELVSKARGRVLIGGLGLGIVALAVQKKPEVTSIIVVEKRKEIIEMVAPRIPLEKIKIVRGDVFDPIWWNRYLHHEEVSEKGRKYYLRTKYDTIYFDIWPNIPNDDGKQEMKELKKMFRPHLERGGYMSCWREKW